MRKQTKLVAVLSATALLAIGASAAAFATGWDNSTGEWQWLDKDGIAVSNEWKKSGNDWFYLGDDGTMAVDEVVEDDGDYYYVNEAGAMVSNAWVSRDNEDGTGDAEYNWYYFGADGKAYKNDSSAVTTSKIKTINGKKYTFDSEGKMLYGWVDKDSVTVNDDDSAWIDADYYFGDWNDGSAQAGWQQLSVEKDGETKTYWFYFDNNGKKKTGEKTINGKKYFLADDGHMLDDWANSTINDAISTDSDVVYLNGDGSKRTKTWVWAVPDEDYIKSDYDDDEYSWFYTKANGTLEKNQVKKINGKSYAFDTYGRMLTGVVTKGEKVSNKDDNGTKYTDMAGDDFAKLSNGSMSKEIYYFSSDKADGSMKKGYQNVDFDDDTFQMYFNTSNGKAEHGYVSKIKKFVANGVVLKANKDESTYAGVPATVNGTSYTLSYTGLKYGTDAEGKILVNAAGAIQKSKLNLKDSNDKYFLTDKNGVVVSVTDTKLKLDNTNGTIECDGKKYSITDNY